MRWVLVLLLFLSSGVFADITCADRKGGTSTTLRGRDGYSGKEACFKDNNCVIKLELFACYGGSGSGNDGAYQWCSYSGIYTGEVCNSSIPPLPQPPTENYCDSASTIDTKKSLQTECEAQGGEFVYSCDRDKGAIDWKCNPKKKPDSGSGDGSTGGVSSDTKTLWRNCGKDDLYCLAFMHASIDNVSRLIKEQTELNRKDFSAFKNGFDTFSGQVSTDLSNVNTKLDSLHGVISNIDSNVFSIDTNVSNIAAAVEHTVNYQTDALKHFNSWEPIFKEYSGYLNDIMNTSDSSSRSLESIVSDNLNRNALLSAQNDKLDEIKTAINNLDLGSSSGDGLTQGQLSRILNDFKHDSERTGTMLNQLLTGQGEALNKTYGDIENIINHKDNPLQNKVFDNPFDNVFKKAQGQCPEFSITMFGETAIIKDHCRALEVLNKFMVIVMWAWCGIALFNDAKEIYLRVTTNS